MMITPVIAKRLETEIERLRTKYDPKTTADLERIAKDEYKVKEVIETPLVCSYSRVIKTPERSIYIFYNAGFKPYEPLALGHEIGHVAVGHMNDGNSPRGTMAEEEADYFSAGLNGISLTKLEFYRTINAFASFNEDFLNAFRWKKEVARLEQMGVYHLLKRFK